MNYVVIFNLGTRNVDVMCDDMGFPEQFSSYEDACEEAKEQIDGEHYKTYKVFAECSKDRNHLV